MELNEELAARVTAIAAIARTGLAWSKELYERERYERIIEIAAEIAELMTAGVEPTQVALARELHAGWLAQVTPGASGYVTPKISTAASVFDAQGRLLLGKRGDSGVWFVPTGWLEVGLTPAQNIIKEVKEETGIDCQILRVLAIRDTRFGRVELNSANQPNPSVIHNIALCFLCEALTTEFKLHPLETKDAGFFEEEEALRLVPERARQVIELSFAARRGELPDTYFDPL